MESDEHGILPDRTGWTPPSTFKQAIAAEFLAEHAGVRGGCRYTPGSAFHADEACHRNTMRLSFARVPRTDIERDVRLLAKLL